MIAMAIFVLVLSVGVILGAFVNLLSRDEGKAYKATMWYFTVTTIIALFLQLFLTERFRAEARENTSISSCKKATERLF